MSASDEISAPMLEGEREERAVRDVRQPEAGV